ncbi:hypothetical protein C4K37_5042 [Pseudomonas chlororaphis subsp. piscium]|nr:hypothetical protein C4K37_5042 [Pseudomonas chlororaphis subsp. piscium]AZC45959.1 hypothetical protein C4K36_5056 [Pseudomonas chlororaphis subsp. piscium]
MLCSTDKEAIMLKQKAVSSLDELQLQAKVVTIEYCLPK